MPGNSTNYGSQTVVWKYITPLVGATLAKGFADIVPAGVYRGLEASISGSTVTVQPGTVFIQDSAFATTRLLVRIEFAATFQANVVQGTGDYLVLRYDWISAADNYAYLVNVASPLATDLVICRVKYGISNTVDNAAKALTPLALFNKDTTSFFVYPGTGMQVLVKGGPIMTPAGKITVNDAALTVPSAGATYVVVYDRVANTFALTLLSSFVMTPGKHLIAQVTSQVTQSKIYEEDIFNTLYRSDFSDFGIVADATLLNAANPITTYLTTFLNTRGGVGQMAPQVYTVGPLVTGMPETGLTWKVTAEVTSGGSQVLLTANAVVAANAKSPTYRLLYASASWGTWKGSPGIFPAAGVMDFNTLLDPGTYTVDSSMSTITNNPPGYADGLLLVMSGLNLAGSKTTTQIFFPTTPASLMFRRAGTGTLGAWLPVGSATGGMSLINTAGPGTFTVPDNVYVIRVTCVGGGGGGGGGAGPGAGASGGGGGGVSASMDTRTTLSVSPGQVIAYTVGAGGAGGGPSVNGSPGGTTSFAGAISGLGAKGGIAASGSVAGIGGAGKPWSGGNGNTLGPFAGSPGVDGPAYLGGPAGSAGVGNGGGGGGAGGGGAGGAGGTNGNGSPGAGFGAGGGGASGQGSYSGGAGAHGAILVEW